MAARSSNIDIRLRVRGGRSSAAQLKAVRREAEAMEIRGAKAMGAFAAKANSLKNFGRNMTRRVTVPIIGVGVVAGKMSLDFSDAMNQISTQAGASEGEVTRMRKSVLDFARTGQSSAGPKELAAGLFRIESAGLRGAKAMEALRKAEALATVGRTDLESASTALAAAVKTGIKGTEDYDKAVGVLNATVGAGNMRMNDLVGALGTGILPSAKQAGLSLQDVGAALGTMTAQGMPAQAAATRMRMAFSQLQAPTEKAKEALAGIGLGPMELARTMQREGLLPTLSKLKSALKDMSKTQQQRVISDIFGGGRTASGIKTLLGSMDDLGKKYKQIGKEAGLFGEKLESANREPAQRLKQQWARIQASLIKFGDKFLPQAADAAEDLGGGLTKFADGFGKLPKPVRTATFGAVLFAAAIGPIAWLVGNVAKATGVLLKSMVLIRKAFVAGRIMQAQFIVGLVAAKVAMFATAAATRAYAAAQWVANVAVGAFPIVAIVAAVVLGVYLIIKHWDKVKETVSKVWGWIKRHWKWLILPLGPIAAPILLVVKHFKWLKNAAVNAFNWVKNAARNFVGFWKSIPGKLKSAGKGMWGWIKDSFKSAVNWLIRKWNSLEFTLPKVSFLGKSVGGGKIGVPDIPLLAEGGFMRGFGSFITGDRGPELGTITPQGVAIQPLSAAPAAALAGGNVIHEHHWYIDGREITESVSHHVRRRAANQ